MTLLQFGYLEEPRWSVNPLAWHAILMVKTHTFESVLRLTSFSIDRFLSFSFSLQVAGFGLAQGLAIVAWTFIPDHGLAKAVHVILHVAGFTVVAIGLAAVVREKNISEEPSLTTLHGWIGAAAIASYGFTLLWGAVMALLTQFWPDSSIRAALACLPVHRATGLSVVAFSALAVLTGVVNTLPDGFCYYTNMNGATYSADSNPADHYKYIPDACKLANGLGVSAFFAAMCVFLVVNLRRRKQDERRSGNISQQQQQQQQQQQHRPEYRFSLPPPNAPPPIKPIKPVSMRYAQAVNSPQHAMAMEKEEGGDYYL